MSLFFSEDLMASYWSLISGDEKRPNLPFWGGNFLTIWAIWKEACFYWLAAAFVLFGTVFAEVLILCPCSGRDKVRGVFFVFHNGFCLNGLMEGALLIRGTRLSSSFGEMSCSLMWLSLSAGAEHTLNFLPLPHKHASSVSPPVCLLAPRWDAARLCGVFFCVSV